jgi:hypothetical protein
LWGTLDAFILPVGYLNWNLSNNSLFYYLDGFVSAGKTVLKLN